MPPSFTEIIGVDVAKATVVVATHGQRQTQELANTPAALRAWLSTLPAGSAIAVESTGQYHRQLLAQALACGQTIYLLNPREVRHYGQSLGRRAKTDHIDALLIARYLAQEHSELHPYCPPSAAQAHITDLVERRHAVVKARTALQQSFEATDAPSALSGTLEQMAKLLDEIDTAIADAVVTEPELAQLQARLMTVVGFGQLVSSVMANLLSRFRFKNSDALIAYIGFDPRARESGSYRGRRILSKRGPAEIRRLLYMAAMSAARTETWKALYQRYRARGLSATASYVILARKMARIAFAMKKQDLPFDRAEVMKLA